MQDFVVDTRYVFEDEMELRLAVRLSDRELSVVGTKGDRLAVYDQLGESAKDGLEPGKFLESLDDAKYQRYVCQDPRDLGPVQRSEPRDYVKVGGEEL